MRSILAILGLAHGSATSSLTQNNGSAGVGAAGKPPSLRQSPPPGGGEEEVVEEEAEEEEPLVTRPPPVAEPDDDEFAIVDEEDDGFAQVPSLSSQSFHAYASLRVNRSAKCPFVPQPGRRTLARF